LLTNTRNRTRRSNDRCDECFTSSLLTTIGHVLRGHRFDDLPEAPCASFTRRRGARRSLAPLSVCDRPLGRGMFIQERENVALPLRNSSEHEVVRVLRRFPKWRIDLQQVWLTTTFHFRSHRLA